MLAAHSYLYRRRIWLLQNLFTHSHLYLLLVATQTLPFTRHSRSYSHWICSWTTRAKWSVSRIWESFPKLSFRLIWEESYKTLLKQSFICLVVDNSHTLCAVLKTIHQHLYTGPIWSIVKHQQIKVKLQDQFFLFLIPRKTEQKMKHYMKLFIPIWKHNKSTEHT